MATTVEKIMHAPTLLKKEASVCRAAEVMAEKNIGSILINVGEGYMILTERDILTKVVAQNKKPWGIKVSEIAADPVYMVYNTATIESAADTFEKHHIRRLPVVEKGKKGNIIVGIITTRDVAEAPFNYFHKSKIGGVRDVKVEKIMREITIVESGATILDAAKIMAEKDIGSVLSKKDGFHGILTERDIVRMVAKNTSPDKSVGDVMSELTHTVSFGKTIRDAIEIFEKFHIRRLPVMKEEKVVGITTTRDVANAISAVTKGEYFKGMSDYTGGSGWW